MTDKSSKIINEHLDEMALKVMMVEPGDLSFVGELVVLVEGLIGLPDIEEFPALKSMCETLEDVLGQIVMAELPDTSENFELLGKCIVQLQEVYRKGGEAPESEKEFLRTLKNMGYAAPGGGAGEAPSADDSEAAGSEMSAEETEEEEPLPEINIDELPSSIPAEPDPIPEKEPQQEKAPAPAAPKPAKAPKPAAQPSARAACGPPTEVSILPQPPVDQMEFLQDLELLSGFVEETLEHVDSIEVNVLALEDAPEDIEIINKIFRPFHTIKGVSGFLNLANIQKLAHCTENLLDDVRNGSRGMDTDIIDVVLKVGDFLKTMVENLKLVMDDGPENYNNYDISGYVEWVKSVQAGQAAAPQPSGTQDEVPIVDSSPDPTDVTSSSAPVDIPAPVASPAPTPAEQKFAAAAAQKKTAGPPAAKSKVGASIKVDVEKLDGLVNAVGELVIMQAMVRANPLVSSISDPKLTKDLSQLFRITSELQKTAMSMRMVPIRQTFQKMIRLVRDLSKKTGKVVNLVMEGEETEIDRNMVESIYDPLVHMMRNSVDHGVQSPVDREKLGKPSAGTVNLRAYQKGGNMVIEIEDDGQGLNTEKIKRKGLERGIIHESSNLSDYELNNLIFLPGFSTADKITDVSGRGVGMDVVKKAVEKLRGKVEVLSEPGKGSLFVIRLPLTLAIIDGIIVRVGEERYIIPTTAIQESLKPREENFNTVQGKGEALMVRNTLVPIIRLYKLFNIEATYTEPCEAIVVVVETEGKQRAIMVDELLGKQEVVIKNLGGLQDIEGVAGGTILGDGRVGLILDLAGLVQSTEHEKRE